MKALTTRELLSLEHPETLVDQIAEGKWGDFITYKCPVCGFDSTSSSITRKHVMGHVAFIVSQRPAVAMPGAGLLFGADGKLIAEEERKGE